MCCRRQGSEVSKAAFLRPSRSERFHVSESFRVEVASKDQPVDGLNAGKRHKGQAGCKLPISDVDHCTRQRQSL